MEKGGFVYILASKGKKLYVGVTSELMLRVRKHKEKRYPDSHTARYNIDQLVYYEEFGSIVDAINREGVLKKMNRLKKVALIVGVNPIWRDLSLAWGKMAPAFDEGNMRESLGFGDIGEKVQNQEQATTKAKYRDSSLRSE